MGRSPRFNEVLIFKMDSQRIIAIPGSIRPGDDGDEVVLDIPGLGEGAIGTLQAADGE